MQYVTFTRFKGMAICGAVNLPALTLVDLRGNMLYWNDKPLCLCTSENAYKYFARDDDGQGMDRGRLTTSIMRILAKPDDKHQARWDKVWEDSVCQKYKRQQFQDYWLWGHAFYNADINDLEYIYQLVKGV